MTRVIAVRLLRPGMTIDRFAYPGAEVLPITVRRVLRAHAHGYVVIEGTDGNGHTVTVPCGHESNHVEILDNEGGAR